jgi:hypothetical protein
MSDNTDNNEVQRLLRARGFTGPLEGVDEDLPEGAPLERSENPEDDPIHAIDLNTYTEDQIKRIPIPEESIAEFRPEEKPRKLRKPPLDGAVDVKDPWTRQAGALGLITVSDEERDEYLRALLLEERYEIPLNLTIGRDTPFVVRARSLYASEKEVVALAVEQVVKNYPIRSLVEGQGPLANMAVATDYYLRLAVMTQVVSINGVPQNPYDCRTEPGQLPEDSPKVAELAVAVRTRFADIHQAKFRLLVQALHTFQTKQLIMEDAMINRDFWKPAGTN